MDGTTTRDIGTDPETGLLNRQGLTRRARELLWLHALQRGVLSCLVVRTQIDAADASRFARHCAATLKAAARFSDVIARLSTADFAVVAPDTDARGARRLAERLVAGIQQFFGPQDAQADTRIVVGYEVVSNLSKVPVGAEALLLRASTAVRTGKSETENRWLRRFTDVVERPAEPVELVAEHPVVRPAAREEQLASA